jgi:hypothetical protein
MAENKKSFILYADAASSWNELTDEEAGQLIKHIFDYVNDKNPVTENRIVKIAFEPIKVQLKRDLRHWENIKNLRSESGRIGGLKSGESRKVKQNEANEPNALNSKQNEANEAVNVSVNVSVINKDVDIPKASRIILKYFGFNEIANFDKLSIISNALTFIVNSGRHEYFQKQFFAYQKYKQSNPNEKRQSLDTFFGTKTNYDNPGWDSQNWEELNKSSNYIHPSKGAAN